MISLIYYSHSDYSDVWKPLFSQTDKYLKKYKKYLFTDNSTEDFDTDWNVIKYDDKLPYQKRVLHCLDQIEEDIFIFHHEDMFLYSQPDESVLKDLKKLVEDEEIDVVKLARASYNNNFPLVKNTSHKNVYENPHNLRFAIQPSICNKEKLQTIYKRTYGNNIWEFEKNSSDICSYFKIKTGMVWREEDNKRGLYHWDSSVYPYFATAVVKGKWYTSDYKDLLVNVLEESRIQISDRGTV